MLESRRLARFFAVWGSIVLWVSAAQAQVISDFYRAANTSWKFGEVGDDVIITGSGFTPGTVTVTFGGVPATFVFVAADTQINTRAPSGAQSGLIGVQKGGGSPVLSTQDFTVIGPEPYVVSLSTNIASSGTPISIEGDNFTGVTITGVSFNGVPASMFSHIAENQLQATVPIGALSGPVRVASTLGTSPDSPGSIFFAPPVITGFSPSNGLAGATVMILGQNFLGATQVRFNNVTATFNFVSNSLISATVPLGAASGLVTVIAPAGGTLSSNSFLVPPLITGFSTNAGPPGTPVTIFGTNFGGLMSVTFSNAAATSLSNSPAGNAITTTVPNGARTGPISVTTTSGVATSAQLFFIPPQINNFTPGEGLAGTPVTINGQNFIGATNVTFNNVPAAFSNNTGGTQITATVPHGALTGLIRVQTPGGAAMSGSNFRVPPVINGFSPASGFIGDMVDIFGTNFTATALVRFGNTNAAFSFLSTAQLRATVPSNAITGPILVFTDGGSDQSDSNFVVLALEISLTATPGNGVVVLSWPTNPPGFHLQVTPSLSSPITWSPVSHPTSMLNGQFLVTNPAALPAEYFRLIRP
jgi:hypothetical protein